MPPAFSSAPPSPPTCASAWRWLKVPQTYPRAKTPRIISTTRCREMAFIFITPSYFLLPSHGYYRNRSTKNVYHCREGLGNNSLRQFQNCADRPRSISYLENEGEL